MSNPKLMPDIEGLAHQVDPLSRRGFFMTASAAAAAGYTLAAGPVRADAINDRHQRAQCRRRQGQGRRRRDAGLFRAARQRAEPAGHPRLPWRFSACTNTSRTSPAGSPSSARSRSRPTTISARATSTKITEQPKLMPLVNAKTDTELFADLDATVGLGEGAGRRHQPARHHGLLPRRPERLALCDAQREPQGRRRLLRQPLPTRTTPRRRARSTSRRR